MTIRCFKINTFLNKNIKNSKKLSKIIKYTLMGNLIREIPNKIMEITQLGGEIWV